MGRIQSARVFQAVILVLAAALGGCGSGDSSTSATSGTGGPTSGSSGSSSGGLSTSGGSLPATDGGCPYCMPGPYAGVCETACPGGSRPVTYQVGQPTVDCAFASTSCSLGLADCGGGSFQCLVDDPSNCGACGHQCATGAQCTNGSCFKQCSGESVRIEIDPQNCGSCENVCAGNDTCGAGACGAPCGATQASCTGVTQITYSDGGVSCLSCPGCTLGFAPLATCVDLESDSNNCGGCGNVCAAGDICTFGLCAAPCTGTQVCAQGSCQAQCPPGFTSCPSPDGPQQCADLRNDPQHCGGCSTSCASCIDGTCVGACSYYGPDAG